MPSRFLRDIRIMRADMDRAVARIHRVYSIAARAATADDHVVTRLTLTTCLSILASVRCCGFPARKFICALRRRISPDAQSSER